MPTSQKCCEDGNSRGKDFSIVYKIGAWNISAEYAQGEKST